MFYIYVSLPCVVLVNQSNGKQPKHVSSSGRLYFLAPIREHLPVWFSKKKKRKIKKKGKKKEKNFADSCSCLVYVIGSVGKFVVMLLA